MGRSEFKFPGKPSKLASKKRVSVLSPSSSSLSAVSVSGGGKSPQVIGINEDTAINNNLSSTSSEPEIQQINSGVRRDDQIKCNGDEAGGSGKNNRNHVAMSAVIKLCACHDLDVGGGGERKSDVSSKSKVCAKCNLPSRSNGCTTQQQLPNGTDNVMSSRNIHDGDKHQVTTIKCGLCNNWWKCRGFRYHNQSAYSGSVVQSLSLSSLNPSIRF